MVLFYLFLLGFPILCQSWIHESGYSCPDNWSFDPKSKTCVRMFKSKKTWNLAREACKGEGADLAAIKSQKTTKTILKLLKSRQRYWVGIEDKDNDGSYKYVDGTAVSKSFLRWAGGEPNNRGGKDRCVEMVGNRKGTWYVNKCSKKRSYVCQVPGVLKLKCPPSWKLFENDKICIRPFTEKLSWNNARARCQTDGGDLLKLYKKSISQFIRDDLLSRQRYWIGAWDEKKNRKFKFIDGKKVKSFVRWARKEPNNHNGNEFCLEVIGNNRVSWNDKRCSRKRNFVCQRPAYVGTEENNVRF